MAAKRGGIEREGGVATDGMEGERGTCSLRAFGDEVEEFGSAVGLRFLKEHRFGRIKDKFHDRPDFFAEELHRVAAGAGVSLPVDVARVIAGGVGAVVLEIHGRAGAAAGELTGLAAPDLGPQRQAHPAGGGEGVGMALLERGGGHGLGRESASAKISR